MLQVVRVLADKPHFAPVCRVCEGQFTGVQPLPIQAQPGREHRVSAVGRVAAARVVQRREVHTDLVGAPSLQVHVEQRAAGVEGRSHLGALVHLEQRGPTLMVGRAPIIEGGLLAVAVLTLLTGGAALFRMNPQTSRSANKRP